MHTIPMSALTGAVRAFQAVLPVIDKHGTSQQWYDAMSAMHRIEAYINALQPMAVDMPKVEAAPIPEFLKVPA